jgi:hypothetical protein
VTITMPDVADTRARMLQAYRDGLLSLIEEATQRPGDVVEDGELTMSLGDWDGVPVVTRKRLDEAVRAIFGQRIPAPSETTVEVSTPATVIVSAVCPRCSVEQRSGMSVHPELLIDDEGSELRVKSKSKGVSHTCGQLALTVAEDEAHEEQIGAFEEIESLVSRVHGLLQEVAALPGEEDAEEMPSIDTIRLWDRATIDQVDRWATAVLAAETDNEVEVQPLPRVLGGEADPEPVFDVATCRVCGCTDMRACEPPCSWVEPDLCSACIDDEPTEDDIADMEGMAEPHPEDKGNGADEDDDLLPGEPDVQA